MSSSVNHDVVSLVPTVSMSVFMARVQWVQAVALKGYTSQTDIEVTVSVECRASVGSSKMNTYLLTWMPNVKNAEKYCGDYLQMLWVGLGLRLGLGLAS